jgi:hypothetical protein
MLCAKTAPHLLPVALHGKFVTPTAKPNDGRCTGQDGGKRQQLEQRLIIQTTPAPERGFFLSIQHAKGFDLSQFEETFARYLIADK